MQTKGQHELIKERERHKRKQKCGLQNSKSSGITEGFEKTRKKTKRKERKQKRLMRIK